VPWARYWIEQKGENTSPYGSGLFSLLSLNIINVINPLLESVRVLAYFLDVAGVVLLKEEPSLSH
jgi:hypothetical protein